MTIDEAIAEATRAATSRAVGSNFRFRVILDINGYKLVPSWDLAQGDNERDAPPPWSSDLLYAWPMPCLIVPKS